MGIVISDNTKKQLLKEFHQYFNITLTSESAFYQGFTHSIPFSKYQNQNKNTILNKYDDVDFKPNKSETCIRVIDGDTLILESGERIRLVGVNTPEKGVTGYETSKKFVEKLCLNALIGIKIDSKKPKDKYGRTLAVVIVENKNLNQILLKEKLAEIMYIPPSEFTPTSWDNTASIANTDDTLLSTNLENQFMNVVIPLDEISGDDYGIGDYLKFFNDDYSNIVVTKTNDFNQLYKCESYKKTLFIRVDPITVQDDNTISITIHLLPKRYDGTSELLLFKDDYHFLNQKKLHLETYIKKRFYATHRIFEKDNDGNYILDNYQDKILTNIINGSFQSGLNGNNRVDRDKINNSNYIEFDKMVKNTHFYQDYNNQNQWIKEEWGQPYDSDKEMFIEFDCDISQYTGTINNIQIDACYRYNKSSPTNAVHYMGVKDISNYDAADRCTLIDANLDKILTGKTTTNYISQFEYVNENPHFPISIDTIQKNNSYTHSHTDKIGQKHYKTIKYFNDRLYSEEKSIEDNEVIKHGHTVGDWVDQSL